MFLAKRGQHSGSGFNQDEAGAAEVEVAKVSV
jgi:hypothetical protein